METYGGERYLLGTIKGADLGGTGAGGTVLLVGRGAIGVLRAWTV